MCWVNLNVQIQVKKGENSNRIEFQPSNRFMKYANYLDKIYKHSMREYPECKELIRHYQNINFNEMNDNQIYQEICWISYSSGFNNEILRKYWPHIYEAYFGFDIKKIIVEYLDIDSAAITVCKKSNFNNMNKAKWCIYNAHRITQLNSSLADGGFKGILKNLVVMKEYDLYSIIPEIKNLLGLKGIGDVTIFHLLKNIGINIFKPDVHVSRILEHIGLLKESNSQRETYYILKQISDEMRIDVSTLDTALFVYGKNNEKNLIESLESIF